MLKLFAHPFSSYCQKALIAFYENEIPFDFKVLDDQHPENQRELAARWPHKHFPVLVDGNQTVVESSIIIEHLQSFYPGPVQLIPTDPKEALAVRALDRILDLWVHTHSQKIVWDALRKPETRDPFGVAQAKAKLNISYAWLDEKLGSQEWLVGHQFSLADCAAAPALFYSDWVSPIDRSLKNLKAYRARLLARPSFAKCVEDARPFRPWFPLGAPDRD